jgi:dTDP-glucose pyrophosphorylase
MKCVFELHDNTTFEQLVKALDVAGQGLLAIIDLSGTLIGIITDGDIRRAFLNKIDDVNSIINHSPEVMSYNSSEPEIISRLKVLHRRHMPLVDENMCLKRIFILDDVKFITRENPVVIMAGGLGSRLGELTKSTPKPMLTVGNQPMLQHLVEMFREQGFRKFIFCVNYKRNVISDFFGNGSKFGVDITYVIEEQRLGTAGALSLINQKINVPFFVINADVLTTLNFITLLDYHLEKKCSATMCVREFSIEIPYGVVNSSDDGYLKSVDEKPTLSFDVNAGIYLLEPSVLECIPKNQFFDMPSLFESLLSNNKRASVFYIQDYWIDIGRKEDLVQANADMQF